ncbi:hypothetical protein JW935_22680 [candidate division KSB1 bacterium]|nr:hypothetical protein [candidate division KSB1 bacterium]
MIECVYSSINFNKKHTFRYYAVENYTFTGISVHHWIPVKFIPAKAATGTTFRRYSAKVLEAGKTFRNRYSTT